MRSVDVSGRISYQSVGARVSRVFSDKRVALRPNPSGGVWDVYFSAQRSKTPDLNKQNVQLTFTEHLAPMPPVYTTTRERGYLEWN